MATTTTTNNSKITLTEQASIIGTLASNGKDYGLELTRFCTRLVFGRLSKIMTKDDNRMSLKLWRDAGNINRIMTAIEQLNGLYELEYDSNGNGKTVCSDSEREKNILNVLRDCVDGEGKDLVQTACAYAVAIINHASENGTLDENVLLRPIGVIDRRSLKSENRKYIDKTPIQLISGEISRYIYQQRKQPIPINYEEQPKITYTDTATGEEREQRNYKALTYVNDSLAEMKKCYQHMRNSGLTPAEIKYFVEHALNGKTIHEIAVEHCKTDKGIENVISSARKKLSVNPELRKQARIDENKIVNPQGLPKIDCVYLVTDITAKRIEAVEYESISAVALALGVSRTAIQKVLKAMDNDEDNKTRLIKKQYAIERKYKD